MVRMPRITTRDSALFVAGAVTGAVVLSMLGGGFAMPVVDLSRLNPFKTGILPSPIPTDLPSFTGYRLPLH